MSGVAAARAVPGRRDLAALRGRVIRVPQPEALPALRRQLPQHLLECLAQLAALDQVPVIEDHGRHGVAVVRSVVVAWF